MKVVYSPRYEVDVGAHVFPFHKYRMVHARLLELGIISASDVIEPAAAGWDDLALVHAPEYLEKLRDGALAPEELGRLQLPWSPAMVEGFRTMVGGTVGAALTACPGPADFRPAEGTFSVAVHVGGGLHHAFPGHAEGFCPLNDIAVAVRVLQRAGVERLAVIDLDVHHGNGTAFIFESDPSVFTFSMHQQHNYPAWKPRGSLDVGLADGADDQTFLRHLEDALPRVLAGGPRCVFYLAGADPYEDDQLGGLRLTLQGLRTRDRMVIEAVKAAGASLVVALAGGYARRVADTVSIHVATVEEARVASRD